MIETSVIISTFNGDRQLDLALRSVLSSADSGTEVIVADDGSSNPATEKVIRSHQESSNVCVLHAKQDDAGFRLARSRNNAFLRSNGRIVIFLDHDIIVPPDFVRVARETMRAGWFVAGRRVMLDEPTSGLLLDGSLPLQELFSARFILDAYRRRMSGRRYLLPLRDRRPGGVPQTFRGMSGFCIVVNREDFVAVDGFEATLESYGAEDWEFMARLGNRGIHAGYLPRRATMYHLWHPKSPVDLNAFGYKLLDDSIASKRVRARKGLSSIQVE